MILIKVEPRADRLYDITVTTAGRVLLNSDQGYSRAVDAEATVRRLWPARRFGLKDREVVVMRVKYLTGQQKTEVLR